MLINKNGENMLIYTFKNGHTTFVEYIKPKLEKTQNFTVVYTHGFCSDPMGRKPEAVKKWCVENGMGFFRYEIAGHGSDVQNFEKTTLETYKMQVFEIIENIVEENVIVMGASLGGWLSLLAGIRYPHKVKGMIGMAAAPDFLKTFMDKYFNEEHKKALENDGKILFPTNDFCYTITKEMIESAEDNLLLNKECIDFEGKVRLYQGMNDAALDWKVAPLIAQKLKSNDVRVVLSKDSNHRLGSDEDIKNILDLLDDFLR